MSGLFDDDDLPEDLDALADADAGDGDTSVPEGQEANPRTTTDLWGHEDIEKSLMADFNAGRMPHAIILAGQPGIGKATLAYRLARFLLSQSDSDGAGLLGEPEKPTSVHIPSQNPVSKRVASGGHSDLLVIEREFDEKKGRMKKDISAEQARAIAPFLRKTAAEGGWRVVIIDHAEEVNPTSQNALLKILEEPPKKTLLILTTSQPAAFLPTIRSRCRVFRMNPLNDILMHKLLDIYAPQVSPTQRATLASLSEGSIGKAIDMLNEGGFSVYNDAAKLLGEAPRIDPLEVQAFAEKYGKFDAETQFNIFFDLLTSSCRRVISAAMHGRKWQGEDLLADALQKIEAYFGTVFMTQLYERLALLHRQSDQFNLDRRQVIVQAFSMLQNPDNQGLMLSA